MTFSAMRINVGGVCPIQQLTTAACMYKIYAIAEGPHDVLVSRNLATHETSHLKKLAIDE